MEAASSCILPASTTHSLVEQKGGSRGKKKIAASNIGSGRNWWFQGFQGNTLLV
jgi:hypothetical protein